ncbi:MAG: S46 family peptidase [Candidatus Eisenbacteria bacterium]|nr:S46 family peptidase [Candidatus Eisenbacteria bacterium]
MKNMFRMRKRPSFRLIVGFCCVAVLTAAACFSVACAGEGMWLPQEIPDGVWRDMQLRGCQLTKDRIYNSQGTGVANAVVRVGATGSFVSSEGLILTNHHVAFGAVQRMSTPEKNYITQGFLAKSREEEVPALGYIAYVSQSVEDVTSKILSAVKPGMSPLERYNAIERKTKEIIRDAEKGRDVYCEVNKFSGGSRYLLYTSLKIKDVRVVYVPSRSIGEYGGEIDNWIWPRHAGDFSFLRAYVAPSGKTAEYSEQNVPYKPKSFLKIAPQGLCDGDFAMIVGFPAWTDRYLTSYALGNIEQFQYPQSIRLQKEMSDLLGEQGKTDPVAAVANASRLKGIDNYLKKEGGMLEGVKKFQLVQQQRDGEKKLLADLRDDPKTLEKCRRVLDGYKSLYEEKSKYEMKDLILGYMVERSPLLRQATQIYKWSVEKVKKDIDRDPEFADRQIPDLKMWLTLFQRGFHPRSDRELFKMFLQESANLPDGQRIAVVDEVLGIKSAGESEKAIEKFLDNVYGNTKLDKTDERMRMFNLSHAKLLKEGDSFINLAAKLYDENEKRIERGKIFSSSRDLLDVQWMEILAKGTKTDLYADGNGTMRINYGRVEGYAPKDAVYYHPFTTVNGVAEKDTGEEPFDCPKKILELAAARSYGSYASPDVGSVPVDLLTTNDSTNGNSGSPLLNSKGELVGCLFDGNYEALSSDFKFQDELTRAISVDIRYVLFVADLVDNAQNVLKELGVK